MGMCIIPGKGGIGVMGRNEGRIEVTNDAANIRDNAAAILGNAVVRQRGSGPRKRLQFSNMQVAGSFFAGSGIGNELSESLVNIKVNNLQILGLLDTGASECFMDSGLVKTLGHYI